jgi:ribulose-5-phosphate 4-epimerase/fuculose-1-phosphate aldolase
VIDNKNGETTMTPVTASVQSIKPGISPEEWKVRVNLAAAFRLAAMQGWDELLFAHLSARVPGEANHFLMHPAHLLFEEVTASNLHKLDENCNHVAERRDPHKVCVPLPRDLRRFSGDAMDALHTKAVTAVAMQGRA